MFKRLSLLCLSFLAVAVSAVTAFAAEAETAASSRADQIGNAIFNLVVEVGVTTFLIHMVLSTFTDIELKKRGTIILAAILLVVYAALLIFFPQVPIPRI